MSEDKVRIVIEIPTGEYKAIKNGFRAWDGGSIVQDAIEETGVPLSDVIDRIRAEALAVIDKYAKGVAE